MRVVVVGAGISGAVTALALARDGHQVLLIDARPAPALGASYANAGLISPGHCFSWAEPGVLKPAFKSMLGFGDGIGICQPWSPSMLRWSALFARECTIGRWLENSKAALTLSAYSRDIQFGNPTINVSRYGGRHAGILYLYGENQAPGLHDAKLLESAHEPFEELTAEALLEREPMLQGSAISFSKGVFSPNDGTGDAAKYAVACVEEARKLGVNVRFGEKVLSLNADYDRITAITTDKEEYKLDALVIAGGLASRELLAPLGYSLPIFPVTGYSVTYEIKSGKVPRLGAVSIPHKVAWAGFGESTVRFTGFADIGHPSCSRSESRLRELEKFAAELLPETAFLTPNRWIGQRPMTPDGLPFLGVGKHRNLILNCGHGAMGWTMSSGCAQVVADLMHGRPPAIELTPFHWDRYHLLGRRVGAQPGLAFSST